MIALAAWIAAQESNRMSERTKAGMERARRAGTHVGRPRKILDRDRLRQLHAGGMSLRAIAAKLKVSAMSVHRIVAA
jgi:DNA invertase Pin-like site-specific DNA recombinase